MSTALLLDTAERLCSGIVRGLEMEPIERKTPVKKGTSPEQMLCCLTIPLAVMHVSELQKRGIETGWEWLVEMWNEENPDQKM